MNSPSCHISFNAIHLAQLNRMIKYIKISFFFFPSLDNKNMFVIYIWQGW